MIWCGVDFETTGLDPKEHRVIEVGAVLYDMERRKPLEMMSQLVQVDVPPSDFIQELTGIEPQDLQNHGTVIEVPLMGLATMMEKAEYVVAHNAPFDKSFYLSECGHTGVPPVEKHWIDSRTDCAHPERYSHRLIHLAAEYGFVNPFAHRAVFDVLTMFKVLEQYDTEQILKWTHSPSVTLRAMVDYAERELAKGRGYHWNGEKKWWLKNVKDFMVDAEREECKREGFELREVEV